MFHLKSSPGTSPGTAKKQGRTSTDLFRGFFASLFLLQLHNLVNHTLNITLEHEDDSIFSGTPERELPHILSAKEKGFT